ncbi:DUF4282 domain-containing protein [Nocardia sp. ET3-3]|uniref:DUF4282 domain-containing protein n=1 Tax=Nocardia terrae TaxID=2675851 RepID=A0A7K1UT04_9NOCA|nr:DUF4282 domain-containing protein [Nocardia terrae]MVU77411.1 DUF4282 domain-containing protein [Nocardia terrae]
MTNQPPQGSGGPGNPQYQSPGFPSYQSASGPHYQASGPTPYQPMAAASDEDGRGFFASLFDFGFTSFITPRVIKVLYVLAMILAGLATLSLALFGFMTGSAAIGIFILIIVCPIYLFAVVLFYRVALEFVMVVFRMGEDMHAIRNRGGMR